MKDHKLKVLNDVVLIRVDVEVPTEEVQTKGGIIIKKDIKDPRNWDIPSIGTVVATGELIPNDRAAVIMNKLVALPSGRFHHAPDPNAMDKTDEELMLEPTRYVWARYSDLSIYFD